MFYFNLIHYLIIGQKFFAIRLSRDQIGINCIKLLSINRSNWLQLVNVHNPARMAGFRPFFGHLQPWPTKPFPLYMKLPNCHWVKDSDQIGLQANKWPSKLPHLSSSCFSSKWSSWVIHACLRDCDILVEYPEAWV